MPKSCKNGMTAETKSDYWAAQPDDCPALVLLVDDQALVAAALQRAVADEPGIDLHYCSNPIEALSVARDLKPTVILLDLVMPGVDGLTLLRKFRANPETMYTPIVVLSTKEEPETKSALFSAGANDYMVKLPDRLELLARIRYHSTSAWHRIQRNEAFEALRRSQQALVASNTALVAANEQLGKATQAKSDFLSSLTKALNTPIQSIVQKAERLLQGTATEVEERRGIKSIRHTAENLERLVGDVRDFSRMEAHKVKLEAVNFDLADLFEELLGAMEGAAAAKGLYLAAMIPPRTPTCLKGDPERLRQVLANLVVNGLEFTTQGAVALRVTQLSETELQAILCFEVQDTGCGIPVEAQTRIFLPFSKGGELPPHDGRGAGLGLAICRELVELMGGHIGLESAPGKGSIFRFTMAFLKQKNGVAQPELADTPEPEAQRVLIVDGRESVRRLIENQLHYFGFPVCGAADAEETLRMLRAPGGLPFELVFLNVPEEDALPLASKIRSEPSLASVRLVLLSHEGAIDSAPWGIDAILPIPLRKPAVLQCIRELGKKSPRPK